MPKSRTPRGLDPEMRRRALAWARDMSRWMADIDEEARWQARRNGRDEPDDDDAITAFCKLFDGGYGLPWSSEWNGEPAGPQPPAPPQGFGGAGRPAGPDLDPGPGVDPA